MLGYVSIHKFLWLEKVEHNTNIRNIMSCVRNIIVFICVISTSLCADSFVEKSKNWIVRQWSDPYVQSYVNMAKGALVASSVLVASDLFYLYCIDFDRDGLDRCDRCGPRYIAGLSMFMLNLVLRHGADWLMEPHEKEKQYWYNLGIAIPHVGLLLNGDGSSLIQGCSGGAHDEIVHARPIGRANRAILRNVIPALAHYISSILGKTAYDESRWIALKRW